MIIQRWKIILWLWYKCGLTSLNGNYLIFVGWPFSQAIRNAGRGRRLLRSIMSRFKALCFASTGASILQGTAINRYLPRALRKGNCKFTLPQIHAWLLLLTIHFFFFQTSMNDDGSLAFDCQHGPAECEANIYHACAIEAIEEPKIVLDMIACMIKDNMNPKNAMVTCAKANRIDHEPIQKCFDSPHGAELLKLHGIATNSIQPPMTFVPTVTLDGQQGRQASILKDFFGSICEVAAGNGPKPKVCLWS